MFRDASSRHVRDADEAINIGSISQADRNPFLDVDLLVRTAASAGAQAIHPGYGYLSENPNFATRTAEAGLIFIGPSPSAMSTLGDKRSSKAYLKTHATDVPLIPGFSGSGQDPGTLANAAAEIGFPVMLKASAGGGGKGMRIVREAGELQHELERARSEAQRSFGSTDVILEKYIESSKHVEVQIVGDSLGNVISLFDRDCSVQRRHQKVIEETPCTFLTDETRREMCDTAVRIAKLIGYANAGTVEFVVDIKTNRFYFLEVNARLQVEHPITEEVTGLDLVSLQLFVAAGGNLRSLPAIQNVSQHGHAIECRLCAEDPQSNFFPEHGDIALWRPADGPFGPGRDVRYESALETSSAVSIYFDSMIAKIVVWAPTRVLAIEKTVRVLAHTACMGIKTNQLFMQSCLLHPAFRDPAYTTSFIPTHLNQLLQPPLNGSNPVQSRKALSAVPGLVLRELADHVATSSHQRPFQNVRRQFRNQRFDPINIHCDIATVKTWPFKSAEHTDTDSQFMYVWKAQEAGGSSQSRELYCLPIPPEQQKDESSKAISDATARYNQLSQALRRGDPMSTSPYSMKIDSWTPAAPTAASQHRPSPFPATLEISINKSKTLAHVAVPSSRTGSNSGSSTGRRLLCHFPSLGSYAEFRVDSLLSFAESIRSVSKSGTGPAQKTVLAPMPCKVLTVLKNPGDEVQAGESVMVIESMKMEVNITVSAGGKFRTDWKQGDAVDEGKMLCCVE